MSENNTNPQGDPVNPEQPSAGGPAPEQPAPTLQMPPQYGWQNQQPPYQGAAPGQQPPYQPGYQQPSYLQPEKKRGLSKGAIAALLVVAAVLIAMIAGAAGMFLGFMGARHYMDDDYGYSYGYYRGGPGMGEMIDPQMDQSWQEWGNCPYRDDDSWERGYRNQPFDDGDQGTAPNQDGTENPDATTEG